MDEKQTNKSINEMSEISLKHHVLYVHVYEWLSFFLHIRIVRRKSLKTTIISVIKKLLGECETLFFLSFTFEIRHKSRE